MNQIVLNKYKDIIYLVKIKKYLLRDYTIYSYRIERAMKINIMQNITLKTKILKSEDLICAVDIHREAVTLVCM